MEEKCFLYETLKFALEKNWKTFIFLKVIQKLKCLASKNSDFLPVFPGLPSSMSRVGSAIWYLKTQLSISSAIYAKNISQTFLLGNNRNKKESTWITSSTAGT